MSKPETAIGQQIWTADGRQWSDLGNVPWRPGDTQTFAARDAGAADQLARALEALTERAFRRCLFPAEVKQAMEALDAYGWPSLGDQP